MFKVEFGLVHSELDTINEGCDPSTSHSRFIEPVEFTAETLPRLLDIVQKHFNVDRGSLLIDSCEELGRLDVQTYTKTLNGLRCSYKKHLKAFKAGEYSLYLNNISGIVIEINNTPNLTEILKNAD